VSQPSPPEVAGHHQPPPGFVGVDQFLVHEIEARALAYALERGLIDCLAGEPRVPPAALSDQAGLRTARLDLLLALLTAGGVVEAHEDGALALTTAFRAMLPYRDLLSAKLDFLAIVAEDLRGLFPALIEDLPRFMERSRTFNLFRYDLCLTVTPENLVAARRWVGYTTCLTRHEAGPCLDRIDLAGHRRLLDLGGNSGEFAAQACARAGHLEATVVDLPVVCALGRENLADRPEASRVVFRPADMRRDPLPEGHDLVTFKSVLHDWPDPDAFGLIAKAAAVLAPGGSLVVFERARLPLREQRTDYASAANLVFEPFFREANLYRDALDRAGLVAVSTETVMLETPFHLVRARKPGRAP
jgi:SAM-dependent methyltransferase